MKKKITFAALIWTATFALSGRGDKPENASESVISVALPNTVDIFNLKRSSDMAVTLYYNVEEPTVAFIMPDGTTLETAELHTEQGKCGFCVSDNNSPFFIFILSHLHLLPHYPHAPPPPPAPWPKR